MASAVTIVNRALTLLGQRAITAFTDTKPGAELATRDYENERDALLAEHPWNFASARTSLPADATAPDWGYARAFDLPDDYLRVLDVSGAQDEEWKVEGRQIVTDLEAPLSILYIRTIDNADLMPPSFREALSARLAMGWALQITGNLDFEVLKAREYQAKLSLARSIDGQEGTPGRIEASSWVDARN